jgi:hypothetical protein
MKVTLSGSPVTLAGEPFKDETGKPFEYKSAIENAILAPYQDEQNLSGEEKLKRWKLALRIHDSEETFTSEEITLMKSLAAKAFTTPIAAQIWLLLEGEAPPTKV